MNKNSLIFLNSREQWWKRKDSFFLMDRISNIFLLFLQQPNRLISPDTLLKRRKGNSFEMATLLCSLLIGTGFSACVVSGYATREVTLNDQRRVDCPFILNDEKV